MMRQSELNVFLRRILEAAEIGMPWEKPDEKTQE
jgi:hypothetical protein